MPPRTSPEKEQTYLRNVSAKKVAVSETIAIPAGAAGVCVDFDVTTRPIASLTGADLGGVGNTSFVLTSTAFTTLVNFKEDADLANGEYYLDHLTGKGRGKKADTSTSGTAAFSVFAMQTVSHDSDDETAGADAASNTSNRSATSARISGFNGTTWDRIRAGITAVASSFTGFLNTLPWAVYNATPTTRTEGQGGPLQGNSKGSLNTTATTLTSGEVQDISAMRVEQQVNYTNISASALIYTGAGRFAGFIVNSCAAGATIKFWDNTSAATTVVLNTITFTAAVAQGPVSVVLPVFIRTTVGLYCTIAVAAMDVTILWRQTT